MGEGHIVLLILTVKLIEAGDQLHDLATLPLEEYSQHPLNVKSWVGPRASLDALEKREISCSCWEPSHNFLVIQIPA
jgi:hypothetical protein